MNIKSKIAIIATAVILLCAGGFGVYKVLDSSKTPAKSSSSAADVNKAGKTEVDYVDYLEAQAKVDENLKKELKHGYKIDDPFVVVNPYGNSPLTAMVIFSTDKKESVNMTVKGKDSAQDINASFEKTKDHIIPVYGLYNGGETEVVLELSGGTKKTIKIKTEKIDTVLENAEVTTYEKDMVDNSMLTFATATTSDENYKACAYDNAGDLRWLISKSLTTGMPLKRLANGHMIASSSRLLSPMYYVSGVVEFDLCGKVYNDYLVPGGQHHDVFEMKNGNLLVASDSEDFSSVEATVVEIERSTGNVLNRINVGDLIEPNDGGSINILGIDWCHNNSVCYDENTDTILLSCRHLDAVLGINKTNKTLSWVLGNPDGWKSVNKDKFFTPVGDDFEWQYAQHHATVTDEGNILLFDNGAGRTKVGKEDKKSTGDNVYSRAVEYKIDTKKMTIEQVWQYGKERGAEWYSSYISGADKLGNSDYWIHSGGIGYNKEKKTYDVSPYTLAGCETSAKINEVKDNKLVYEIVVPSNTYRSTRLPMYSSVGGYDVNTQGTYLGTLGEVKTIDNPNVDISKSANVDFEITALQKMPDRLLVSGSWTETKDDAALVLVDETGKMFSYKIKAAAKAEGAETVNFSVWMNDKSIPGGHEYSIYLYNGGVLYDTNQFVRFYVDTRVSADNMGAQMALYDVDGSAYSLVSSNDFNGKTIETDIKKNESSVENSKKIDEALTKELESGKYDFQNPQVIQNPYQITPLSAVVLFNTDKEYKVKVTVKGKDSANDIVSTIDAAKSHKIPIVGLYANYENSIVLELLDGKNTVDTKEIKIKTDALPEKLDGVVKAKRNTKESSMGLMIVSGIQAPYLYGFDQAGDIRWFCLNNTMYYGAFPLENGNLLVETDDVLFPNASMPNSPEFYEMDLLGRVHNIYFFPEGIHHEIKEKTPNGNFLVATNSNDGYEQNSIQEIDRTTGKVVKTLVLDDVLNGLSYIDKDDWAHINTVSYDEDTDTILISPRNLHSGMRINWTTNEIEWILCNPEFWKGTEFYDKVLQPKGVSQWHYQQHTVYEIKEDLDNNPDTIQIALFDNHYNQHRKVSYYDDTNKSYVKIYAVNVKKGTVKLLHNYESDFSRITSDYIYIPQAKRVFSVCAYFDPKIDGNGGMVYEYDYDSEEILNQWAISHHFYRGYNINVNLNSLAGDLKIENNYLKGNLRAPVKVENPVNLTTSRILKKQVTFSLRNNILYAKSDDHSFTQIIFNGKNGTFVYDISDIKMVTDPNKSFKYGLPIPLNTLEKDTYSIQVMYQDELYDAENTITVK